MNTIPSTFNEHLTNCTIQSGNEMQNKVPGNSFGNGISVILLNRGNSHLRLQNLEVLTSSVFSSIISVETDNSNYSLSDFTQKFPEVKFIIPHEKTNDGDLLNLAMGESTGKYVLVIRDSLNITPAMLTESYAKKILSSDRFCIVPRLASSNGEALPINFTPKIVKNNLRIESSLSVNDGIKTLYPFDYIGIYNREKFIQLGGFDYTIDNPYWQNLDLSFRAWLWGEQISISTVMKLNYSEDNPIEDSTPDLYQLRFFLKNMAVRYRLDHGEIPARYFWTFLFTSACGLSESVNQFAACRRWVKQNKYRFKKDALSLIANWSRI